METLPARTRLITARPSERNGQVLQACPFCFYRDAVMQLIPRRRIP